MNPADTSPMDPGDRRLVENFWSQRLIPAAEALRARGVTLLERRPDPQVASYYTPWRGSAVPFTTLEPDAWESMLRRLWLDQGLPELAALAGPLMELSRRLKVPEEEDADVSPFIYVMF